MDLHPKQLVRVNVGKIQAEGCERVVNRNFCVDPRTITLERLRHLVARALNLREEFSILILRSGNSAPLLLEGDWDLEGALSEENKIDLVLRLHPKEPGLEEWDIICPGDVPVAGHEVLCSDHQANRKGSFLDQVFQRSNSVLSEPEFLSVCDWPCPLRHATYRAGGADHALRPALWMHLLDVYPAGATPTEREEFLNRKAEEYYGLRHSWQKLVQAGTVPASLRDVTCLVRKDVRRTDRHLPTDPPDERALYNVLTTFAAHHPSLGYCQGMSDLLSPLLHVMRTEARAYVAFCALMGRMRDNFRRDGRSVRTKFAHLRRAIRARDPQLHAHLQRVGATDLLFCYRWLLLDLKREFPYQEMLTLTEVLWSTLPPLECQDGVRLYEERFPSPSDCESIRERDLDPRDLLTFTEDHFGPRRSTTPKSLKRWAMIARRQSIAKNVETSSDDEDDAKDVPTNRRRPRRRRHSISNSWSGRAGSFPEICPGKEQRYSCTVHEMRIDGWLEEANHPPRIRLGSSDSNYGSNFSDEELLTEASDDEHNPQTMSRSEGYTSGHSRTVTDSDECSSSSSFDSVDTYYFGDDSCHLLPPPTRFGDGKPFLMFLCLGMILNHRDAILAREMDANEMGIYFDRLVRKHRLAEVLPRAKEMFSEYLRSGWTDDD